MVRSKSLANAADAASGGRGTHCYQWKIGGQCFVPYPCRVLVRVDSVNIHNKVRDILGFSPWAVYSVIGVYRRCLESDLLYGHYQILYMYFQKYYCTSIKL